MKPHSDPACAICGICLMCIGEKKAEHDKEKHEEQVRRMSESSDMESEG